jgi:hypothetical protein
MVHKTTPKNASHYKNENGGSSNQERIGNEKSEHHRIPGCKSSLRETVEGSCEPWNEHAKADVPGVSAGRSGHQRGVRSHVGEARRLARIETVENRVTQAASNQKEYAKEQSHSRGSDSHPLIVLALHHW